MIVREIVIPLPLAGGASPADGLGDKLLLVGHLEEDRPPVGPDGVEDELEDLREQGVEVDHVADRLGRLVHHGEVEQAILEPVAHGLGGFQDPRAFAHGHAPEDRRAVVEVGPAQHVDPGGQLALDLGGGVLEQEDRLAQADLVPGPRADWAIAWSFRKVPLAEPRSTTW